MPTILNQMPRIWALSLIATMTGVLFMVGSSQAERAGYQSITYSSHAVRLVTRLPGTVGRILLEPSSVFVQGQQRHRLDRGTLLVAATSELPGSERLVIVVDQVVVTIFQGKVVLESYPPTGSLVHVLEGSVIIQMGQGQFRIDAGTSLIAERGTTPRTLALSNSITQSWQRVLDDLGRERVTASLRAPRVIQVRQAEGDIGYPIAVDSLDEDLGKIEPRTFSVSSTVLDVQEHLKQFLDFLLPGGSTQIVFSTQVNGIPCEEAVLRISRHAASGGSEIRNELLAGDQSYVRTVVDEDSLITTSRGGSLFVERTFGTDMTPTRPTRYRVLSGYGFLQGRPQETGIIPSKDGTRGVRNKQNIVGPTLSPGRLTNLSLITFDEGLNPSGVPNLISRDVSSLLDLQLEDRSGEDQDPVSRLRWRFASYISETSDIRTTSILQKLPQHESQLLGFLPIHSKSPSAETVYLLALCRPGLSADASPVDSYLIELVSPRMTSTPPSVEVVLDERSRRADNGSSRKGILYLLRGRTAFEFADDLVEEGHIHKDRTDALDRGQLGLLVSMSAGLWSALVLAVVSTLLYILMQSSFFRKRYRKRLKCLICGGTLDEYPLVTGDPLKSTEIFEALAAFEVSGDIPAARAFGCAIRTYLKSSRGARGPESLSFQIRLNWCFKCEDGKILTHLSNDGSIVDESDVGFQSVEILTILRKMG